MKKQLFAKLAALPALAVSGLALAQTDPVTTAMTTASGQITTYATALVGVAVVAVGFMIGIKYIKKIRGAA